jgi:hypothetical protein
VAAWACYADGYNYRRLDLAASSPVAKRRPPISTAAAIIGLVSLGIQLLGLIAAVLTPYDSQGAVGKAHVVILTEMAAIPAALVGLSVSIGGRLWLGRSDNRLAIGWRTSLAALIPFAAIYLVYAARL